MNELYYLGASLIWAWLLAIVLAIVLVLTFLSKRNEGKYHGFLASVYGLLNFQKLTLTAVLKFVYLVSAIGYALSTFFNLFNHGFVGFLIGLIGLMITEVMLRIFFEFTMLVVIGVTNIVEINRKLGGKTGKTLEFVEPNTDLYADKIAKKVQEVKENIQNKTEENKPEEPKEEEK